MEGRTTLKQVLSTKMLSEPQKKKLSEVTINLFEYEALHIEYIDFETPATIQNAIFTSKNAVRAVKNSNKSALLGSFEHCYCVGESTKAILEENGQKVTKSAKNSSELANFIKNQLKNEAFYFFCGNLRRDEIPEKLKMAEITCFEVKTYKTKLNSVKFDQKWDYILFFSPSGVQSFISKNNFGDAAAICIGETTASEAIKYTQSTHLSDETTIDSVIEKAISVIKNNPI
jgi:uroporphyrinogen-III synthase